MDPLSEPQIQILQALAACFYLVVPARLQTYCSLTSRISQAALRRLGIDSTLVPCQVWLARATGNFVVGFTGSTHPGKWDGHVICRAHDWFIDAALRHFDREFGLDVPGLVTGRIIPVASQAIARVDLSVQDRLWWYQPPAGSDTSLPDDPAELVARYVPALEEHVRQRLGG